MSAEFKRFDPNTKRALAFEKNWFAYECISCIFAIAGG